MVENRGVGGIVVASEDLAGHDHPKGGAEGHQGADLHRRGLGAEQPGVVDVEGVLGVAGRVPGGHVDEGEVVAVVLHLGTAQGQVPELGEDPADLPGHSRDRVEVAAPQRRGRPGQVEGLGGDRDLPLLPLKLGATGLHVLLEPAAHLVDREAVLALGVGVGDGADPAPHQGQLAIAAPEEPSPRPVEGSQVACGAHRLQSAPQDLVQVVGDHAVSQRLSPLVARAAVRRRRARPWPPQPDG